MDVITTVTGPIPADTAGITDAHNHIWIAPVIADRSDLPVLCDRPSILAELEDYRRAGGGMQVDFQPGGCGRDGRVLAELSRASGVRIVACTGFHRARYYPDGHWLWHASAEEARAYFIQEITEGLDETLSSDALVRAGLIKIACEESLRATPLALVEAAAGANLETGAAIAVHTEQGADAEEIVSWLAKYGVQPRRVVLCHMDKRPDHALHRALAQEGVMLEYDTFYRPRYQPDLHVWPLLEAMVADGLASQIALGTDMAASSMWSRLGGPWSALPGPGLTGLITQIRPRLQAMGFEPLVVEQLTGANIARRLARSVTS